MFFNKYIFTGDGDACSAGGGADDDDDKVCGTGADGGSAIC